MRDRRREGGACSWVPNTRVNCQHRPFLPPCPPLSYLLSRYVEAHLKGIPGVIASVYDRATRNCYWVGSLWASAIRAHDRTGAVEAAGTAYRKALGSGMQVRARVRGWVLG